MLSGKLIGNRKERSSTYQLFTQGSLGFFSEFSLANIFKCLPIQRMEYKRPQPAAHPGSLRKQNAGFPRALWTCQSRKGTLYLRRCHLWALPSAGPALSGIMEREPGALDISFRCPGNLKWSYSGHFCLIGDNWLASSARLLETDSCM